MTHAQLNPVEAIVPNSEMVFSYVNMQEFYRPFNIAHEEQQMEFALMYIKKQVASLREGILVANKDISQLMNKEKQREIEKEVEQKMLHK